MQDRVYMDWQVGCTASMDVEPSEWVPASVPGCAQRDWARAKGWPEVEWAGNVSDYDGLEDLFWVYRAIVPEGVDNSFSLVIEGVDYECTVKNGSGATLAQGQGLYANQIVNLSDCHGNATCTPGEPIKIWVHPAPKSRPGEPYYMQADASTKPAVSYEWDFHPRLIPLGLWRHVYFEPIQTNPVLHDLAIRVLDSGARALVSGFVLWPEVPSSSEVAVTLCDCEGVVVATEQCPMEQGCGMGSLAFAFQLENPRLWWPRGHGDQHLYELRVLVDNEIVKRQTIGIRDAKLVMHPTQWEEIKEYPAGRTTSPITLQINGRRIFAKGCNWVCPTMFPGELTDELVEEHVQLAYDLGVNILRCWGGAAMMPPRFYDLCDRLGIMVWQEFPLACNRYEGTDEYLRVLTTEALAILQSLRPSHPCVVMWCGGNELFNNWSLMTDQDLALRLLDKLCYENDRDTPYLMTSPAMGMAHGGYMFHRDDGKEVFEYFPLYAHTAYTEFGTCGPCDVATLERIIPEAERWPIVPGGAWSLRHAVNPKGSFWRLDLPSVRKFFGEPPDLATLVEQAQWLQAESFRFIYEEARRQHPTCAMALNWCLNEPWPDAANNSLIAWPSTPKPAYAAVQSSLRTTLASARVPHFGWRPGEQFTAEMFLLHDGIEPVPPCTIRAELLVDAVTVPLGEWHCAGAAPQANTQGPHLNTILPSMPRGDLMLTLTCTDFPELSQQYRLWSYGENKPEAT